MHEGSSTEALSEDKSGAEYALEQIGMLYKVETMADDQDLDYEARAELRSRLAYPIMCAFEKWIVNYMPKAITQRQNEQSINVYIFALPPVVQVSP